MNNVSIVDFYCSEKGEMLTNAELFDSIQEAIVQQASEEHQALYDKLLGSQQKRSRHVVHSMDKVVNLKDRKDRLEMYEDSLKTLMTDAVSGLFKKTDLKPETIDFLVVTSSVGKTMPSAASIVAKSFPFHDQLVTLNLGDMACSSGLAALDAGMRFLKSERKAKRCLVVSVEAVTNLFNDSNDGVVPNTLFGEGCAAILLSTHQEPALYTITHSVRTISPEEDAFQAIRFTENEAGPSIRLSKSIPEVAGRAIKKNLQIFVPQILTLAQKLHYLVTKKVPQWQQNADYWAVHPGGTSVLSGVTKNLKLCKGDLGYSYRVFMNRSNMSSPTIFYVLNEIEKSAPKRGEKIIMMTFGSGFKVNTMMLKRKVSGVKNPTNLLKLDAQRDKLTLSLLNPQNSGNNESNESNENNENNERPLAVLNIKSMDQSELNDAIKTVWENSLGLDKIVISKTVINHVNHSEIKSIVKALYALLLPKGEINFQFDETDGSILEAYDPAIQTLVRSLQKSCPEKFSTQSKKVQVMTGKELTDSDRPESDEHYERQVSFIVPGLTGG